MNINKELLKGSTVPLLLALLEDQPMYGYEMIKTMEKESHGVFALKEGTLYPILHALEADGLVHAYWSESGPQRRRKYYCITAEGKQHLKTKRAEWTLFSSTVNRVLGEGSL